MSCCRMPQTEKTRGTDRKRQKDTERDRKRAPDTFVACNNKENQIILSVTHIFFSARTYIYIFGLQYVNPKSHGSHNLLTLG